MNNKLSLSNQKVAHDILDVANKNLGKHFSARPRNYYNPSETAWFIVPSTDWPSFKHGKIVLYKYNNLYRMGIYLEKGIGTEAKKFNISDTTKRQWIEDDWIWHDFLDDLKNGVVEKKLKEISSEIDLPLRLVVQASNAVSNTGRDDDLIDKDELDNSIVFQCENGEITLIHDGFITELRKFKKCSEISDLITIFDNKALDWLWVDVYMICEIDPGNYQSIPDIAVKFINSYKELFGID